MTAAKSDSVKWTFELLPSGEWRIERPDIGEVIEAPDVFSAIEYLAASVTDLPGVVALAHNVARRTAEMERWIMDAIEAGWPDGR